MIDQKLHSQLIENYVSDAKHCGVSLRLVGRSDAKFILSLRSDTNLNQHISATKQCIESQNEWISSYLERYKKGNEAYFLIIHGGKPRGTIRLYDYDKAADVATYGSWVMSPDAPTSCAFSSTILNHDLCFHVLNFASLRFSVRSLNKSVWRFHECVGAKFISEGQSSRFYEINTEIYPTVRARLDRLARQFYERPVS